MAHYTPDSTLAGKTLEEIAAAWHLTPVDAYVRVVKATSAELDTGQQMEDIIATPMSE